MPRMCLAHSRHLAHARRMLGRCQALARHMHGMFQAYAWLTLGITQAYAGICLAFARLLLSICLAHARHGLANACQANASHVPDICMQAKGRLLSVVRRSGLLAVDLAPGCVVSNLFFCIGNSPCSPSPAQLNSPHRLRHGTNKSIVGI